MGYRILAELTFLIHLAFVVFVVFGGLLAFRWRRVAWLHLPAAAWGAWIEFAGWGCPLTPLENRLRAQSGDAGYETGFIEHYLLPLLYPAAPSRGLHYALGALVVAVNAVVYGLVLRRRARA